MKNIFGFAIVLLAVSGCAVMHHAQVGDIVSHPGYVQRPFEIKLSETGVDVGEAARVSKVFLSKRNSEAVDKAAGILGLFQMGPRTGNPVYLEGYADDLANLIYQHCPSGNVTGLMSIRETMKYPVISGEIVKITGYCLVKKGG